MTLTPCSFFLLIFFGALLSWLNHRERHVFNELLAKGRPPAKEDECWLSEIIRQVNDQSAFRFCHDKACWLKWRGMSYLFFYGSVSYSMSGWRFNHYRRDSIRCLVPSSESAQKLLQNHPRMFRKLAETNQAKIFYIRRLSEFVKEIQD